MTKSVAELTANKPAGRRMGNQEVCLAPDLVAEMQVLLSEHDDLLAAVPMTPPPEPPTDDDESDGPPSRLVGEKKKAAEPPHPNIALASDLRVRIAELLEEIGEFTADLTVRANLTDGEWRMWANAHPARDEDEPGYERDQRVTAGFCDADALINDLGLFVHAWNSEPITPEQWADIFEPAIGNADKADVASRVVSLYERRLDFQGLRSALSPILKRLNDSSSPATSASPTSASTAGSPDESPAATTETATA